MKILFFGDVFARPGREGLIKALTEYKTEYSPDVVIANVENSAHGKGVTPKIIAELKAVGVHAFTSGNHVFSKEEMGREAFNEYPELIRPENYLGSWPGSGHYSFFVGSQRVLVVNLGGKVFFDKQFAGPIANPFTSISALLDRESQRGDIILVDFHAEATSEKNALGLYLDGRVTGVFGTHTHIPTADARVLPKGTAFITDVGMCGVKDSVIGVKAQNAIDAGVQETRLKFEIAEGDEVVVHAVLVETDGSTATRITHLRKFVTLTN